MDRKRRGNASVAGVVICHSVDDGEAIAVDRHRQQCYKAKMNPTLLSSAVILSATILLANIGASSAIKCYVCSSATGSGCTSSDFSSATQLDNCNYCLKNVGSTSVTGEVVTRSCVAACSEGGANVGGVSSHNYCCQDELCNGAVKLGNTLPVAVLLAAAIAIVARLL